MLKSHKNATEMHFWKLDCPISLNEMAQNSISKNFHKVLKELKSVCRDFLVVVFVLYIIYIL